MKLVEVLSSDYEIRNYDKLDKILVKLCNEIIEGQKTDPDMYGMVAACVLDPDNNQILSTSTNVDGKWKHAERNAIEIYEKTYGKIPEGSIILTTLSPCNKHMDDREGAPCATLIEQAGVFKVYCGYIDPTQNHGKEDHRHFNLMETQNAQIRELCESFADTFLN